MASVLCFLVVWLQGMWDLSSQIRDWICTPCFGRWSPNHSTAREILYYMHCKNHLEKKNHLERRSIDFINHPRDSCVIHKWGRNPVIQTWGSGLEKLTFAQGHPGGSQVQLGQTWPRSGVTSFVQRMALVSMDSWCFSREALQDHCERNEDAFILALKFKA